MQRSILSLFLCPFFMLWANAEELVLKVELVDEETLTDIQPHLLKPKMTLDLNKGIRVLDKIMILEKVIAVGSKVWSIVENNHPVANWEEQSMHALPEGADSFRDLSGWRGPKSASVRITYENPFGVKVVDVIFRLGFYYGGHVRGVGSYLSYVHVTPAYLSVAWAYEFNANAAIPSVVNKGTMENPIAEVLVHTGWMVKTALTHQKGGISFVVGGEGYLRQLQ